MYSNVNAPPNVMGANIAPSPTYTAPAYAYCCPTPRNDDFILIVVLFILLIIIGACCYSFDKC